jgi:hypothetical protein
VVAILFGQKRAANALFLESQGVFSMGDGWTA